MNSDHDTSARTSIRDRILAKIEHNEVRMHSRTYFALKVSGALALAALILLITVFIGNFVFFMLRINGHGALLSLGTHGWSIFLRVFPWWLLITDIALAALLAWVVRHFQFGYRKPIIVVFLALAAAALAGGFALDEGTPLNDRLLHEADRGALPFVLDDFYKGARRAPPNDSAFRGTVVSVQQGSFSLADPDFDDVRMVIPADPSQSFSSVFIGETVLVIGSEDRGVIHAVAVHQIDADALPPQDD